MADNAKTFKSKLTHHLYLILSHPPKRIITMVWQSLGFTTISITT